MKINTLPDAQSALSAAALKFTQLLAKYNQEDRPILLLLSGGSAFSLLNEVNSDELNENITIGVLDERFSDDPSINNFLQLAETGFFSRAKHKNCSFIDTRPFPHETPAELASRFESELMKWKGTNRRGRIIITQGIGEDGHTAGILPFRPDSKKFRRLFDSGKFVVSYDATEIENNKFPLRVTTTLDFLKRVNNSIVFVAGESKRNALEETLKARGSLERTPARIIHAMKGVSIFTDLKV